MALYEAQLREAIHHLSEGITAEDATRASIESMRSIHAKEGVRRKEQDADETVEERIARTERDLCCLQRAVELIAVVSKGASFSNNSEDVRPLNPQHHWRWVFSD